MERFTSGTLIRLAATTAICLLAGIANLRVNAQEIVLPLAAAAQQATYPVQLVSHCDGCAPAAPCGCNNAACTGSCSLSDSCNTGCSGDVCCDPCYDPCRSFWAVRANALYMKRDQPDSLVLMEETITAPNPENELNARQFDFDYQAGYELALITQPACGWGAELRFMSVQDFDASVDQPIVSDMADPLQINTVDPTFVQDVALIDAEYDSGFHSFEANLRRQCHNVAYLIGFRYLELDERMFADLQGSNPAATYTVNTQNRLYGIQAGAEGTLTQCGRFRLDAVAKGGLYLNSANHASYYFNGVINQPGIDDSDDAAFIGELGLFGVYELNCNWSIRGGYQGLWFTGMALASDQIPATDLFNQNGIDSEGDTFFHGGVLGLEYRR